MSSEVGYVDPVYNTNYFLDICTQGEITIIASGYFKQLVKAWAANRPVPVLNIAKIIAFMIFQGMNIVLNVVNDQIEIIKFNKKYNITDDWYLFGMAWTDKLGPMGKLIKHRGMLSINACNIYPCTS